MTKKTILTVEDDIDVLANINIILSEEGYNIISAKEGKTGLELAKKEKPDLIICDIAMPEMDGYEVLEELSKDNSTKTIPFIFLTARVGRNDFRKGMLLGADDYLFKPFDMDDLINSVKTRLKRVETLKSKGKLNEEKVDNDEYSLDDKIFIQLNNHSEFIIVKDIVFITAENQYTSINLNNEKSLLLRKSTAYWEQKLPGNKFIRIHRSTIINMDYISKIEKSYNSSFLIYLQNIQEPFSVSKRYSAKIRKNMI